MSGIMRPVKSRENATFYCFSPPVMVGTLLIELALATYTTWRYKMTVIARLATITLFALATFQLSEYFVCTGIGSMATQWSRIGFVAITALPPLGLHMAHVLAGKGSRRLVYTGYATMAAYMGFFLLAPGTFTGHECTGNYVIFQFTPTVTGLYTLYYFGWLAVGIGLSFRWANQLLHKGKAAAEKLHTVQGIILGYLVFLVPSALSMAIKPEARRGIPSVLCGFAIFYALILAFYIMPRAGKLREQPLTKPGN